jgi:O-antigen/teichoic acid export membrane protein
MRNIIFISAILLISLSFILIPIYGILGAAIAISATAIIQNIAAYVAVRKTLGINTLNIFKQ